jgi:hypothetical protein
MKSLSSGGPAALALIAFLALANVSYSFLVARFGYDDVLREPVETVLSRFAAGGAGLVLAWAGFALSALIFVGAAPLVALALQARHGPKVWIVTALGMASGLLQAVGLFRWVFVIPVLSRDYPAADPAHRAAIEVAYTVLNQYGGVTLGEHLGQILLVVWSAGVLAACWRAGGALKWTSLIGWISLPLWGLAQTELYATVIPQMPVIEMAPFAFMIWMVWILALAVALWFQKPSAPTAV